jgi:hypothetical protein
MAWPKKGEDTIVQPRPVPLTFSRFKTDINTALPVATAGPRVIHVKSTTPLVDEEMPIEGFPFRFVPKWELYMYPGKDKGFLRKSPALEKITKPNQTWAYCHRPGPVSILIESDLREHSRDICCHEKCSGFIILHLAYEIIYL